MILGLAEVASMTIRHGARMPSHRNFSILSQTVRLLEPISAGGDPAKTEAPLAFASSPTCIGMLMIGAHVTRPAAGRRRH